MRIKWKKKRKFGEGCRGLGLDYMNWEVRGLQSSSLAAEVRTADAGTGTARAGQSESHFYYKLILTYRHLFRVKARLSQTLRELRGLQFLSYINHLASPLQAPD